MRCYLPNTVAMQLSKYIKLIISSNPKSVSRCQLIMPHHQSINQIKSVYSVAHAMYNSKTNNASNVNVNVNVNVSG